MILIFISWAAISPSLSAQEKFNRETDTNNLFFPIKYFIDTINSNGQKKDEQFYKMRLQGDWYQNSIYSEPLMKLNEPKLFKDYDKETYRFTWFGYLGTSHNPFTIRIEKSDTSILMYVKYIESKHRKEGSSVRLMSDTLTVNNLVWLGFKKKIDSLNFWILPPIKKTDIVTMDGSVWIFEGRNNSLYHMVHRSCGDIDKKIREVCLYLLEKSELKIKKKEFY